MSDNNYSNHIEWALGFVTIVLSGIAAWFHKKMKQAEAYGSNQTAQQDKISNIVKSINSLENKIDDLTQKVNLYNDKVLYMEGQIKHHEEDLDSLTESDKQISSIRERLAWMEAKLEKDG